MDDEDPKAPRGRYRPEFAEQAFKLCLLGATNAELKQFFNVTGGETLQRWCREHPDFAEALRAGKEQADAKVAESLYKRALGYSHPAVKIVADANTGASQVVEYTEHYPPDTSACIFWLKNRRPDVWRDRHELTGKNGGPIETKAITSEVEVDRRIAELEGKLSPRTNGHNGTGTHH